MSMEIHLFQDPTRGTWTKQDVIAQLSKIKGLEWGNAKDGYHPFSIKDPRTGGFADGDVGLPPDLEKDEIHPEKTYEGVHDLQVRFLIPLVAPTWIVDCVASWIEQLAIPGVLVLDTEDTRDPQGADGPSPLHPPRLAASWAAQHLVQCQSLMNVPRLSGAASASVFRYRRAAEQDSSWPQIQVLSRGTEATTVCVWPDSVHWHLPPVDWVATSHGEVFPVSAVIAAAGDPPPDERSLARPIALSENSIHSEASDLDGWNWCGNGEWADTLPLDG